MIVELLLGQKLELKEVEDDLSEGESRSDVNGGQAGFEMVN